MDLRLPTPDASGFADSNGVRIAWEAFGSGPSTVLVIPTWNFVDSRVSANLVPDLARDLRVVTYDPRGAGRSDHPATGYRVTDHRSDALAVLAAVGAERVSLIAGSSGANPAALLAVEQPDRVERLILIAPAVLVPPEEPSPDDAYFWVERDRYEGWDRWSAPYWRQDWPAFARWFLELVFNEPDSEPVIEAMLRIALEADPEVLIQQHRDGRAGGDSVAVRDILGDHRGPDTHRPWQVRRLGRPDRGGGAAWGHPGLDPGRRPRGRPPTGHPLARADQPAARRVPHGPAVDTAARARDQGLTSTLASRSGSGRLASTQADASARARSTAAPIRSSPR